MFEVYDPRIKYHTSQRVRGIRGYGVSCHPYSIRPNNILLVHDACRILFDDMKLDEAVFITIASKFEYGLYSNHMPYHEVSEVYRISSQLWHQRVNPEPNISNNIYRSFTIAHVDVLLDTQEQANHFSQALEEQYLMHVLAGKIATPEPIGG